MTKAIDSRHTSLRHKIASRRILLALLGVGMTSFVGGCGFAPVYSQNGSGLGKVDIAPIEGRTGFFLEQELKRNAALEKDASTPRTLKVKVTRDFQNIAQGQDSFYKRVQINYTISYVLSDGRTNHDIKGAFKDSVAFDGSSNSYSEVALQEDAEQRAAKQISDRIWRELLIANKAANPQ